MNILVLCHELPPIGGGGGRAAYDVCTHLAGLGHHVTILTAHFQSLPREDLLDGIHILRIPSLRKESYRASFAAMIGYVLAALWSGWRFIRIHKPDVIHAHFAVPAGAVAFVLSILTGVPYILTAHLGDVPGAVPEKTDQWFRWIKPFTHMIWKRARAVVAVSEYTRQLAMKNYAVDIRVIPNGVDLSTLPSEIKLNNPIQIIFAGRFMPQKNPLAIVDVLAALKDLNWRCAMLGNGPLLQDVKYEIEKHGMSGRFDMPGWVTPQEVLNLLLKSDILFMPSLSEGLPVVGVQALASGLALVVSDIGGFIDLVDQDQNGFLVPMQDYDGFEFALRRLISTPDLLARYRTASLIKSSQFGLDQVALKYNSIFEGLLK